MTITSSTPRTESRSCKQTALYRAHDGTGLLLYVGISDAPLSRLAQHDRYALWADDVRTITVEWHPSRSHAEDAETAAVRREDPVYNLAKRSPVRFAQWMLALDRGCHADDVPEGDAVASLQRLDQRATTNVSRGGDAQ